MTTPDQMTAVLAAAKEGRLKDKLYIDVWCDGSTACAVETEPPAQHGHWRGGYSVAADEVILRLKEERDAAQFEVKRLRAEADTMRNRIAVLREALEDVREWAHQDDILAFEDGDIPLADFCDRALKGEK